MHEMYEQAYKKIVLCVYVSTLHPTIWEKKCVDIQVYVNNGIITVT